MDDEVAPHRFELSDAELDELLSMSDEELAAHDRAASEAVAMREVARLEQLLACPAWDGGPRGAGGASR